jgi:apolipoprotein D and lipocalin family protein
MAAMQRRLLPTLLSCWATLAGAAPAIEQLNVPSYMGRWYQAAHYPNRFQKQCLSDTAATYRLLEGGAVEVRNECRTANGMEVVLGRARPRGSVLVAGALRPASLEVAFAPTWMRWASLVWGPYDVVRLLDDAQVSIVSEPNKEYLWVLSRKPTLSAATWEEIERWLKQEGFDVARLQRETHGAKP